MNLREAAQQALEALCLPCDRWNRRQTEIINASITALRAVLAEDRSADTGKTSDQSEEALEMVATINEMETVEPVAWMVYTLDGESAFITDNPEDFTPEHRALPLYTAPPQRKPLTEKQIESTVCAEYVEKVVTRYDITIARAIERAHGIGGEE